MIDRLRSLAVLLSLTVLAGAAPAATPDPAPPQDWPHQLTVYTIPSPWGMDWSSPRALALRGLSNQLGVRHIGHKHAIGHVFVGLRDPSLAHEVLTGMTTESQTEEIELAKDLGYGLGVMGADMLGKFDPAEKLQGELDMRYETGLVSYLRVLLSPENGARVARFFLEYQARGLHRHYGGANRPRYGEGAGCSAFGVAFLDVAGLLEPEYEARWKVVLRVPERLYGGPRTGHEIPLRRVMAWGRWAREDEPHVKTVMWDPSMIYDWVQERWQEEHEVPSERWIPELRGRARGLVVDARDRPAPAEPLWLQDQPGTVHPFGRQSGTHNRCSLEGASLPGPGPGLEGAAGVP